MMHSLRVPAFIPECCKEKKKQGPVPKKKYVYQDLYPTKHTVGKPASSSLHQVGGIK